ncbi:MAG: DNA/RNA nuclease SfsA [Alkalispirochaeta sp.]
MNYPLTIPGVSPPSRFAHFCRRPNRFVAEIELLPDGNITTASMPNPGRMQEILLPGTLLGINPGPQGGRHPWRVHTLHRNGTAIPLDTGAANRIARFLLDHRLISGLEDRPVPAAEVTPPEGKSRFDFELAASRGSEAEAGQPSYLEVKSCTLFNGLWALFPDAVTDRGRRHVKELAQHPGSVILFLVHSAEVEFFSPDVHVDPAFSHTLWTYRDAVQIVPVALDWGRDMTIQAPPRVLSVPWERIAPGLEDRGSYLIVLYLPTKCTIAVGALGSRTFPAGYYVYVGSAMRHLTHRITRHRLRRRKRKHWHIDYFRDAANYVATYAIRDPYRREEEVASAVHAISDAAIPGFGSSDSGRQSHMFHFEDDPTIDARFQEIVLMFRRRVFG